MEKSRKANTYKKGNRMGKTEQYTGSCIYCGQIRVIAGGEGLTENEVNHLATLECNCDEAQYMQRVEQKKTYAKANIKRLFAEDNAKLAELLLMTVGDLAWQRIRKVTITDSEGIQATLTGKEAKIKVERREVKKSILED